MQWRRIFRNRALLDWHLVMYFLNTFLVIYGYGLRGGAFQAAKLIRTGLVIVSLLGILFAQGQIKYIFNQQKNWALYGFIGLNVVVLPFSVDVFWSFQRLSAWIPFLIYTNFFVVYLFKHYSKDEAKIKLLQVFSLAYFYPVAMMLVTGVAFQATNVYGQYVGVYKANVIGWACTLFIVSSFDLYANSPMKKWVQYLFFFIAFLTLWGIVLTGSRSSYAGLALSSAVLIARNRKISIYLKAAALTCILAFAYYIVMSPDSVVNLRSKYAGIRRQRGEIRFQLAQKAFEVFTNDPGVLLTGFGFDNFKAGLEVYADVHTDLASHNSYLEILFSGGLLSFLFFLIFYAINAFWVYVRYDSPYFVFLPSLMIIPYFESNLNAGQFLFFPWMTVLFYYIHVRSLQIPVHEMSLHNTQKREA